MGKTTDIREAVEAELDFDPLVDAADITVRNIKGDVALNGTVPSYPQYIEAGAAAQRIDGVKNVHNHLEVVLPPGDYRDDALLTTAANDALTLNVTVPAGIEASARDGNLTLTGTVKYGAERTAAELAVAALTGVRNIRDYIEIGYDADPEDVDILVQDALDRWALIPDDSDVKVDTRGNTVTLTGHVRTWAEHDAVIDAAWMARGVNDVNDILTIAADPRVPPHHRRVHGQRTDRLRAVGHREVASYHHGRPDMRCCRGRGTLGYSCAARWALA